ncbi:MAG: amylo-alpha-1,6-glucosidase [Elusimicrobia bacterium]|nr:amylo-alpha-1,6-glucosidase [Elusimicrobiota bacterium]
MSPRSRAPRPARGEEIIQVRGKYYILSSSALADDRTRILKHGDTFAVFDRFGDAHPLRFGEQGMYHEGTRHLSRLELRIEKMRPFLLSSTVLEDNTLLAVDLTNPDFISAGRVKVPRGTIHIFRSIFLYDGVCHEKLRVANFGLTPIATELNISFDADFADIFEVRGAVREKRGARLPARAVSNGRIIVYRGLDGVARRTEIRWSLPLGCGASPSEGPGAAFRLRLGVQESKILHLSYACRADGSSGGRRGFARAHRSALKDREKIRSGECRVSTSNEQFNDWLNRSYSDVHMMTTRIGKRLYPYAGVPWFSTVFGRDGILTAWFYLWVNPVLARGVLEHLAEFQSTENAPARDAEPGKILHEMRRGEMAALGEIPFGRYYGSVDATPLFVGLAGAYFERTGDLAFIRGLWPKIERALDWIERSGDADGDGFVEYGRRSKAGLVNQGWKDSDDSIFHADGSLVRGPVALCEVQACVYDAYRAASVLAAALGRADRARDLDRMADALQARFETAFWSEKLGFYALALDGSKRTCAVRASNAGQCLFSGIARPDRAGRTASALLGPDFFTGWGVRTLAAGEARYNPMSYHNGSVWPHDNALIAAGLARYGFKSEASRLLQGLFDASQFMEQSRLPELFCGFKRRPAEGPTHYPVACSPQAWASASVFMLIKSVLGLRVEAAKGRIIFDHPMLPSFLEELRFRDLRAGGGSADLLLRRHASDVSINVVSRRGPIEVVVIK